MEIRSSQEAANAVASALRDTGLGYCQFEMGHIGGVLPVSGSAIRDGSLAGDSKYALAMWARFLVNRSEAVQQMGDLMAGADTAAAIGFDRG